MFNKKNFFKGVIALMFLFSCDNGIQKGKQFSSIQQIATGSLDSPGPDESAKFNTEDYDYIVENKFLSAIKDPLSTFSVDVDEAAYSKVRRYIQNGSSTLPITKK
ncbi:MAG: von Willebrand factor type A domain-containing protein [Ferruginibacter sp.]